jgi:hypothetical protein
MCWRGARAKHSQCARPARQPRRESSDIQSQGGGRRRAHRPGGVVQPAAPSAARRVQLPARREPPPGLRTVRWRCARGGAARVLRPAALQPLRRCLTGQRHKPAAKRAAASAAATAPRLCLPQATGGPPLAAAPRCPTASRRSCSGSAAPSAPTLATPMRFRPAHPPAGAPAVPAPAETRRRAVSGQALRRGEGPKLLRPTAGGGGGQDLQGALYRRCRPRTPLGALRPPSAAGGQEKGSHVYSWGP